MEKNKVGSFIAKKRKEKGLTQQELGNILYVTDKAISKWERGLSMPDIALLTKLADVLDVTINDILNGEKTDKFIDIEKELLKLKKEINNKHKTKLLILIIIFIFIITTIIILNISFGYKTKTVNYNHANIAKKIEIGVPKTSFLMKLSILSISALTLESLYQIMVMKHLALQELQLLVTIIQVVHLAKYPQFMAVSLIMKKVIVIYSLTYI